MIRATALRLLACFAGIATVRSPGAALDELRGLRDVLDARIAALESAEDAAAEEPAAMRSPPQYSFGTNWWHFMDGTLAADPADGLNLATRASPMLDHLRNEFDIDSFAGKTFLDIGCGSGLASLAAFILGADRVVSFDVQARSVETTLRVRAALAKQFLVTDEKIERWQVMQGSVLDEVFLGSLAPADLVYSFGVLHHTDDVWGAIRNAAKLVRHDGLLLLYLQHRESEPVEKLARWTDFKRSYGLMASWEQERAQLAYLFSELSDPMRECLGGREAPVHDIGGNFARFDAVRSCLSDLFRAFSLSNRGMDFLADMRDWLGGYPYHAVGADELIQFLAQLDDGPLRTVRLLSTGLQGILATPMHSTADAHLRPDLFEMPPEEIISLRELLDHPDAGKLALHVLADAAPSGECYVYRLPSYKHEDCIIYPARNICARLPITAVLENDAIIGWGGYTDGISPHQDGRFCDGSGLARWLVFRRIVVFSIAGGGDPRRSGKRYHVARASRASFLRRSFGHEEGDETS